MNWQWTWLTDMQPPGSASSCKTSFWERTWLELSTGSAPPCVAVVVLTPRADVVRDRDAERRRRLGKVAYQPGDQDVADLDLVLRTRTPRLGLWLDTSDLSVEQTTDQILKQLDSQATVRRQ